MIRHWKAWDEGKRSHLFVADAQTGECQGPDAQARGQHPPCPVRRVVGLRLVARRQGARLHRRARPGRRLVDQHRHLDRSRRRAASPRTSRPATRAPTHSPPIHPTASGSRTSARHERPSSRTSGCSRSSAARRATSYELTKALDRPIASFAWASKPNTLAAIIDDMGTEPIIAIEPGIVTDGPSPTAAARRRSSRGWSPAASSPA